MKEDRGGDGDRTHYLLHAMQALYQLSYAPEGSGDAYQGDIPGPGEQALRRLGVRWTRATRPPKFRYNATLANEIEQRWQDRWEAERVFWTPNRDRPARRGPARSGRSAGAVRARHVPVPERQGTARRAPARLHRHRRVRALPAHERLQRAARDGLRRVRVARPSSTRCRPGQHPRVTTEQNIATMKRQLRALGLGARPAPRSGHDRRVVLPLDAVDLPADLQLLVRRRRRSGPADRRAGRRVPQRRAADARRRHPVRRSGRRASSASWSTRTGSRTSPRRR